MSSTPLALILDDRPSRHRYIQKELGQAYQIICCFEPQEAIDLLLENSLVFSFVSLDFQLGHPTMDGLSVVLALKNAAQNPDVLAKLQKAKWRVHSMDYEGGPNMVHTLREFLGNGFVQDHFPLP